MVSYSSVCEAKTKVDMRAQFGALLVDCAKKFGGKKKDHEKLQMSNVGYFASYYDEKTRKRVYDWLGAAHPIFGASIPTTEEALDAGRKLANTK